MVRSFARCFTLMTVALAALAMTPRMAAAAEATGPDGVQRVSRGTAAAHQRSVLRALRVVDRRIAAIGERARLRDRSSSLDESSRFFGEADPRRRLVATSSAGGASRPTVPSQGGSESDFPRGGGGNLPTPTPVQKTLLSSGLARRLTQWKLGRPSFDGFASEVDPDNSTDRPGGIIPPPPSPPPAVPPPPTGGVRVSEGNGNGFSGPPVTGVGDSATLHLRDLLNPQLAAELHGGLRSGDPELRLLALARLRQELARQIASNEASRRR